MHPQGRFEKPDESLLRPRSVTQGDKHLIHNQMRGVHGYHGADFALKNMNQSQNLLEEAEFDRFN